jgi:hypothetical protein|tara:strand:- start:101 stop:427 length:327 start_codon:yes stop_codon:yes gene_type:complete
MDKNQAPTPRMEMVSQNIRVERWEELMEIYDGCLMADGFEEALIGFGTRFNNPVTIYDLNKCRSILVERDGMSQEEAMEYMDFNVLGAYVGDETPIFLGDYINETTSI